MKNLPSLFILLLGASAALASGSPAEELSTLETIGKPAIASGETPVRARLTADRLGARPGSTVTLAVHLTQDEGWHTYWINPGDAGYATSVEWELPEGFAVSEIHWPTPEEFLDPAGLVSYGYDRNAVLLSELHIDDAVEPGNYRLKGSVDWLMCREQCIPGDAEVELEFLVAETTTQVMGPDYELIEAARQRVPRPVETFSQWSFHAEAPSDLVPGGEGTATLEVKGLDEAVQWHWYPYAPDTVFPGRAESEPFAEGLKLLLPVELDSTQAAGETLQWGGVLELRDGEPEFVEILIPLVIGAESASASGGLFDPGAGGAEIPGQGSSRSVLYYLALAFVGGILLNIMPCVLPVLSLKVLGFVQHANSDRATVLRLGLLFAAGVLVSFLALALAVVGIQQAGEQLGWGFQFQNPIFVVVMAAVVFAFGLSLFGVYEIILPVGMGGGAQHGAGAESFFNGVLATALATPCTAPFLGTALGFAFTQPAVVILAIFLTVGVGLALPYVLLSVNPAWLRFVPKPGAWMNHFKQAMGFLLMATLVWLLWVLGRQLGMEAVVASLAFLCAFGFALWLYGAAVSFSSGTGRRVTVLSLVVAVTVLSAWGFLREPLQSANVALAATDTVATHDGWMPFSVEELEGQVAAGNTVFLDFTADWCLTCKANEKTVLSTDEVQTRMRELGVVAMVGDYTRKDPVITKVLRRFGRSGVPLYVVFPAGRIDEPIVLPEAITKGMVLDALDRAGPSRVAAVNQLGR